MYYVCTYVCMRIYMSTLLAYMHKCLLRSRLSDLLKPRSRTRQSWLRFQTLNPWTEIPIQLKKTCLSNHLSNQTEAPYKPPKSTTNKHHKPNHTTTNKNIKKQTRQKPKEKLQESQGAASPKNPKLQEQQP